MDTERTTRATIIVLAILAVPCQAQSVPFGPTVRVSVSSSGGEGQAASGVGSGRTVAVSWDGRCVAFESEAVLDAMDTNGTTDIYLHDRTTGTTTLVSATPAGAAGNGRSLMPTISDDGRFVAFMSFASDLVLPDNNAAPDVFVHDRLSNLTRHVSVSSLGALGSGSSYAPVISGDGSTIAFASSSFNLVPGDTNFRDDVFVHAWATGLTTRVSVSSAGVQGDGHSGHLYPWDGGRTIGISTDGSVVVFLSRATQLVAPPPPPWGTGSPQVYLHDRGMGATVLVGRGPSHADFIFAEGPVALVEPGPRVIVTAKTTSAHPSAVLWDLNGTRTVLNSQTWPAGTALTRISAVSRDGSRMAAHGVVPSNSNPYNNVVMVHHPPSGPSLVASVNDQGELPASGWLVRGTALSPDGRWLAWESDASNVVANDTNGLPDVFLTDLGPWTSLGGARGLSATNLGPPVLWGVGDLDPTRTSWLIVRRGPDSVPSLLSVSGTSVPVTVGGATLFAWPPSLLVPFVTSPSGTASFPYVWPGGMAGIEFFAQAGFADRAFPGSLAVTNALRVVTPP